MAKKTSARFTYRGKNNFNTCYEVKQCFVNQLLFGFDEFANIKATF